MGLRVRVYGCERMRRERLIGETIISFASIDLELETNLWLPLEPRNSSVVRLKHFLDFVISWIYNEIFQLSGSSSDLLSLARSDSTGSTTSMQQHGGVPELLIGLGYNGTTGRLTVEIIKGSHFRNLSLGKAPDTYVKLCLVSSMGQEIARSKTSTKRGQPNPLFKETFIFQVNFDIYGIFLNEIWHIFSGCPFSTQWCYTDDFCVFKTKYETQRNGRMVFFGAQFEWSRRSSTF